MDLGVHLPLMPFGDERLSLGRLAKAVDTAKGCGFAAVSANDHVIFQTPWLDGPTALASMIERSGLRGPVPLAKALAAIDVLSDGRLVAAVGPGSSKRDYDAVGVSFEERWKRFDEALAILRTLLKQEPLPDDARYYLVPPDIELAPIRASALGFLCGLEAGARGRGSLGWRGRRRLARLGLLSPPAAAGQGLRARPFNFAFVVDAFSRPVDAARPLVTEVQRAGGRLDLQVEPPARTTNCPTAAASKCASKGRPRVRVRVAHQALHALARRRDAIAQPQLGRHAPRAVDGAVLGVDRLDLFDQPGVGQLTVRRRARRPGVKLDVETPSGSQTTETGRGPHPRRRRRSHARSRAPDGERNTAVQDMLGLTRPSSCAAAEGDAGRRWRTRRQLLRG